MHYPNGCIPVTAIATILPPMPVNRFGHASDSNMVAYSTALATARGGYVQRDADAVLTIFPYTLWCNRDWVYTRVLAYGW